MFENVQINYEVNNVLGCLVSVTDTKDSFPMHDLSSTFIVEKGRDTLVESLELILIEQERDCNPSQPTRFETDKREEVEESDDFHFTGASEVTFESSPEVLRLLVKSNFLDYKDIGRLLLLVSKSIASLGFLNDDIWITLLKNRFGNEIADQIMAGLQCGPQQCFRHLIKNEPVKPISSTFMPKDYRIVINIYNGDGERILFRIAQGDQFPRFFNDGILVMKDRDGVTKPIYTRYSGLFKTKATVHLVRIPDQRSLCVIDDRRGLNEYSLERKYVIFSTSMAPSSGLSLVDEGAERLLNSFIDFSKGLYFNLRLKIRKTTSRDHCSDGNNVALYGSIVLEAICYPTDALFRDGRTGNKDLKFLDILEKLYGW